MSSEHKVEGNRQRGCCSGSERDVFRGYESIMAKRFQTKKKRIGYFVLIFILSCLASGPLNAWVTLEPLLGDLHVLGSTPNHASAALNEVQVMGFSFGSLFSIPLGLIYDIYGPRALSTGGALAASAGSVFMALAISQKKYNWILFWAYPLTSVGGSMSSMSILGWQWMLPNHQNFISSLYSASLAVSDTLAILGVVLIKSKFLTLQQFFFAVGGVSLISAIGCYLIVPSKTENSMHFAIVQNEIQKIESGERTQPINNAGKDNQHHPIGDEEILLLKQSVDESKKVTSCNSTCKSLTRSILGLRKVISKFPVPILLSQAFICMIYWSVFYPMASMFNFYVLTLGEKDAVLLVSLFSAIYGITGGLCSVFAGKLCDKIGVVTFQRYTLVLFLITSVLQVIPSFTAQIIWIIFWTLSFNVLLIIYFRMAMHYAPMELFGAFQGMFGTFMVVPQLLFSGILREYMTSTFPNDPRQYFYPYVILNVTTLILAICLCIYWWRYPPPNVGRVIYTKSGKICFLDEDEEDEDDQEDQACTQRSLLNKELNNLNEFFRGRVNSNYYDEQLKKPSARRRASTLPGRIRGGSLSDVGVRCPDGRWRATTETSIFCE